ncbi:MAG: S-adenosyl-L-methionine-dependent methyltransferase [Piptocephalis tieghemiana]|nr:MAG: S-adenosyl-L-methionine-dependent methyltransferase [Piptocephalis tieghemiana]
MVWTDGRRHHSNGSRYPCSLPMDELEMDRSDTEHLALQYICNGRNFLAVLPASPEKILDVGCGSGKWVREVASTYSEERVYGCDLLLDCIPKSPPMPANASFQYGNVLDRLPYPDGSFDFVHQRHLWSIPTPRWPDALAELFRVTLPGGICEVCESDGAIFNPSHSAQNAQELTSWAQLVFLDRDVNLNDAARLATMMEAVGFINVERHEIRMHMGEWGGRLGRIVAEARLGLFEACRATSRGRSDIPTKKWQELVKGFKHECETVKDMYIRSYAYIGQKPPLGQ